MEIKSPLKECPNGHVYDGTKNSVCPFCVSQGLIPPPAEGAESFTPTAPVMEDVIGGNIGGMSGTLPVDNRDDTVSGAGNFIPTEPADMGFNSTVESTGPVVGWLVCVEGPMKGNDYRLHTGFNYIGREIGDIHIHGDPQISREKNAMIAFDSRNLTYYVGPASGLNMIYLNEQPVLSAMQLNNYDVITMGSTKLMFVALCGDWFRWTKE